MLPLHYEFFRRTLSHSTIIADGNCQLETTGFLEYSNHNFEKSVTSTNLGNIWNSGEIRRTLFKFPHSNDTDFIIDIFQIEPNDTRSHDYFHVLHSGGAFNLISGGVLTPYPGNLTFGNSVSD